MNPLDIPIPVHGWCIKRCLKAALTWSYMLVEVTFTDWCMISLLIERQCSAANSW